MWVLYGRIRFVTQAEDVAARCSLTMPAKGTVARQLCRWSMEDPDKPAFIFRGTQVGNRRVILTREDVFHLASCFASKVREAGVQQGEVVCNTLPNSPERLITDLGLMMAGAVAMNGPIFLADGTDLVQCLAGGDCVAMVLDTSQPKNVLSVLGDRVCVRGVNARCREDPSLRKVAYVLL